MSEIRKYKIHTDTEYCGEWNDYVAYCDDEHYSKMEDIVNMQAYETYHDFRSEDEEEESDDEWYYTIEEWSDPDEEWDWYEVIYDCREEK